MMSYVGKIIAQDEQLHGIARLHWIYVVKGLAWFLALAFVGWALDSLITHGLAVIGRATDSNTMIPALITLSSGAMMFMMASGFMIFFLFVLKVLVTEVALSSRRVILKEGWIFVKVKQVDIEEIRGENLDKGTLGSILGYGYLMLDCRFIGDVKLPAIENPERFLRALHVVRSKSQDVLSIAVGKGNAVGAIPVGAIDGPDTPAVTPPQPTPEIQPGQQPSQPEVQPAQTPQPEIRPEPVPHSPPPPSTPPSQPQTTPAQPPQPIPPPLNPEPPLQPPSGQAVAVDPVAVASVIQQVMPQMAEQVIKQMAEKGMVVNDAKAAAHDGENPVDTDLIDRFDEARLMKDANGHEMRDKMEYAIH
ncbi:MAG: hypothetical protein DI551_00445 [Micavibrio aeruginosavorus]|uniref:DUF304 domain-containing protein n=1 Tax=Micavibrio aeruginosavorus TaxID=349221 RepID=A0A2W5NEF7_9BACT|nr:MAG: hypothetical protein DI551_00445 [Micavibrio aeruginosavorus]